MGNGNIMFDDGVFFIRKLICYLTVLLERILQFKVLKNEYCSKDIFSFIKDFTVVKAENKYINISKNTAFINALSSRFNLPLNNYFLSETQIKKVMKLRCVISHTSYHHFLLFDSKVRYH